MKTDFVPIGSIATSGKNQSIKTFYAFTRSLGWPYERRLPVINALYAFLKSRLRRSGLRGDILHVGLGWTGQL